MGSCCIIQGAQPGALWQPAAAKSLQSCPTLCDPIDGSPPGSSVPGILQARTLEWVAISFSSACMHAKLLQSCPTLCDPTDSSPPGSSVHGENRQEYWSGLPFPSPLWQPRGVKQGMEVGDSFKREGVYIYFQLIHVVVQQKQAQHCKAIIL